MQDLGAFDLLDVFLRNVSGLRSASITSVDEDAVVRLTSVLGMTFVHLFDPMLGGLGSFVPTDYYTSKKMQT